MLKVCKFGGSSVANATQFQKIKKIVEADDTRKIIVVSALGKREKADSKITDLLYLLSAHIKYNINYDQIFDEIKNRFLEIEYELKLETTLKNDFDSFKLELKNLTEEYIVSRGEYFTAKLMAFHLNYTFVDAKDLFVFDYDGKQNFLKTENNIKETLMKHGKIVVPGFYGAYPNKEIKLMTRGGSDITGAIMAGAVSASLYENYTDVSGILMADPKVVSVIPKRVEQITYGELRELSYMGASVLHEETIFPVREKNIPILLLNTNAPHEGGTMICNDGEIVNSIKGIVGKRNYAILTITKKYYASKTNIIFRVLQICNKYNLNVEHIPSSVDSFSLVYEKKDTNKFLYDLINELKREEDIVDITVDNDLSMIAVVGNCMKDSFMMSKEIFEILGKTEIDIKLIVKENHEISLIIGVSNAHFEQAINTLYLNIGHS